MPTYQFECEKCGFIDEVILLISKRDAHRNCPKCVNLLTRLIGLGKLIIFKGTGFYETDYKRNSHE